jgi:phosphatidylethanolamine-binding protein (PEBP) family uncharacterized protein
MHRFLTALDVESLGLDANTAPGFVGYMLHSHTLSKASVVGYYGR